jgi:hypothetical protein
MEKVIVCVRDNIAEIFHDVRCEVNTASAIRAFEQSVKESPHKNDYALWLVAHQDTTTGEIKPCEPVRIYSGTEVMTNNVTDIKEGK